ncbi:MAG: adaptor protein MecA [Lachnospiraceae bacterium]|nr:adaptor protein MecA [Lachnospiraceae bacterium]MBP5184124.1 adaptor protein MecA [Lachnospiraceae bacterium]
MKIEKISDNQMKFTLTREDLASRQIRVNELAYGSEKVHALFSELIQRANEDYGFETEDLPLIIEAIPTVSESLILMVTKCDDPEELDARFSNFTPAKNPAPVKRGPMADEILNIFGKIEDYIGRKVADAYAGTETQPAPADRETDDLKAVFSMVYVFDRISVISELAAAVKPFYHGASSLYKDPRSGLYYLVIRKSDHTPQEFNRICNMASEYGDPTHTSYATVEYFDEHFDLILKDNALSELMKL